MQREDRFSKFKAHLGYYTTIPFKIQFKRNTAPITPRSHRINPVIPKQVKIILDTYLGADPIDPSTSTWCCPFVCIPKKDGSIWITVKYRRLNAASVVDKCPLPRIDDFIDSLGTGKIHLAFDLFHGSFRVAIDRDSVDLTVCVTPEAFKTGDVCLKVMQAAPAIL